MFSENEPLPSNLATARRQAHDIVLACVLALLTTVLRTTNRGELYFVDGPRLAFAITSRSFVIQPPGYWVFAHLGGLFHDPASGLAFWNIFFSSLGVGLFYLLCRLRQGSQLVCFLAAAAYSSVYFIWFSGEIHSVYASQIFFPALALFSFFRFQEECRLGWAVAWSFSSAASMALRPSDGVFLLPLWFFLLLTYVKDKKVWALYLGTNACVFLAWYLPTRHALRENHLLTTSATLLMSMQTMSPLIIGINARSMANVARVIVPLLAALWPLVPSLAGRRPSRDTKMALMWMLPGLCFFALCYMADPTYLVFLTGSFFWLVVTASDTRRSIVCLTLCGVLNVSMFLFARPLYGEGSSNRLADFLVIKYCRYGLQHKWSSTLGNGAQVP